MFDGMAIKDKNAIKNTHIKALHDAAAYLINNINEDGYISASADYPWYHPHWFRDSSWVAVSLIRYADFCRNSGSSYDEALQAASHIIAFNAKAIAHFSGNMKSLNEIRFEDPDFFSLEHHIPSRVNALGELYTHGEIDDRKELGTRHSWLIQYDSAPLILYSINEKAKLFGLDDSELSFLKEYAKVIAEYMGRIYITECASAWEIGEGLLHAYDIASVYSGFESLKELSEKYDIGIMKDDLEKIENRLIEGGPLRLLKEFFVANNVLYNDKKPFAEKPIEGSIDSSEIFIFLNFGITDQALGCENVEQNTIATIEKELFGSNMLPIRFKGDTYYKGGRWLLLGLAFAEYYLRKGAIEKGLAIIDYVIGKYKGSYPEQEIINTASDIDMENFYARNGYKPIQNLAWSYAAVIMAIVALLQYKEVQKYNSLKRK
ncbi:MAG: hypothetical protein QW774_03605 [Candidatus Micrarchaeaceae archaeon]